jgi:hypothetical protein
MASVYCTRCGNPNGPEARFCARCGSTVAADDTTTPAAVVGAPVQNAASQAKPLVRTPFAIAGVGVLFCALAFFSFSALGPKLNPDSASTSTADPREQARAALLRSPSQFLDVTDAKYFDKGIINDYRQLVDLTILNRSAFAVLNVTGAVDWYDGQGNNVGSIPFSIAGSIASGDTKSFSTREGTLKTETLQTKAKTGKVRVTHVDIVE